MGSISHTDLVSEQLSSNCHVARGAQGGALPAALLRGRRVPAAALRRAHGLPLQPRLALDVAEVRVFGLVWFRLVWFVSRRRGRALLLAHPTPFVPLGFHPLHSISPRAATSAIVRSTPPSPRARGGRAVWVGPRVRVVATPRDLDAAPRRAAPRRDATRLPSHGDDDDHRGLPPTTRDVVIVTGSSCSTSGCCSCSAPPPGPGCRARRRPSTRRSRRTRSRRVAQRPQRRRRRGVARGRRPALHHRRARARSLARSLARSVEAFLVFARARARVSPPPPTRGELGGRAPPPPAPWHLTRLVMTRRARARSLADGRHDVRRHARRRARAAAVGRGAAARRRAWPRRREQQRRQQRLARRGRQVLGRHGAVAGPSVARVRWWV